MFKTKLGLAIFLASLSGYAFADIVDVNEFFSANGGFGNVTAAQAFRGQTMTTYSGGSASFRVPSKTYSIAGMTPPSLSAGCGGIDMYGGSFSFINADQLINAFQNIGNNAKGAIFQLAIQSVSPQLGGVMDYMQDLSQKLNALNVNSCQMATGLVNAAASEAGMVNNDKTLSTYGANVAGIGSDFWDMKNKISKNISDRQAVQDSINRGDASTDSMKKVDRNIVWYALSRYTSHNGDSIDDRTKRLAMSLFGTVECIADASFGSWCTYVDGTLTPEMIVGDIVGVGANQGASTIMLLGGGCSGAPASSSSADNNASMPSSCMGANLRSTSPWQIPITTSGSAANVPNINSLVAYYIRSTVELIKTRGAMFGSNAQVDPNISTRYSGQSLNEALKEEEKIGFQIISKSGFPVWLLMKSAGSDGVGESLLNNNMKMISSEISYKLISSLAQLVLDAINREEKGTQDQSVLSSLQTLRENIRETKKLALEEWKKAQGTLADQLSFSMHANDNIEREKAQVIQNLMNSRK